MASMRTRSIGRMHLGFHVPATLVDVELHAHVAVVLQREEKMIRVFDRNGAMLLDVARVDWSRALAADVKHRVIHILGQHQGQRLEPLDDLMHVLQHA
jgi:hypothetical protein